MTLLRENVTNEVSGATHIFETTVSLEEGLTVLIGQTLAGKTSLMRIMAGLDRPSSGRVLVDGRDVTGEPVQKRNVAMVYQQFINYPSLTVYDNIASPLKLEKTDKKEIDRRVREVAEQVHITQFLDRLPAELSGGQQQRTAMARALVKNAELLLFDEPLVNLDYKLREELRAEMRDIFKRRKAIVVYATTEPLEALLLGGSAVVVDQGRVLQTGPTVEVYHHPASVRVGQVFSDPPMNLVEGVVSDSEALLGKDIRLPLSGHLKELKPGRYNFGARANHLFVARSSAEDVEIRGITDLAEVSGSETFVHVTHHGTSWVVQEEGVYPVGMGREIVVFVNPRHIFVFDQGGQLIAAPPRPSET